jgi:hypothetical protein
LENNWKYKSLENLEKKNWDYLKEEESSLLKTCFQLSKKPVGEFEIEDLRIMIGQSFGLNHLIPIAIDVLNQNILAEGDYYEGDLLNSVLNSSDDYWKNSKDNWKIICELIESNMNLLQNFDTTSSIKERWFSQYEKFKKIHDLK